MTSTAGLAIISAYESWALGRGVPRLWETRSAKVSARAIDLDATAEMRAPGTCAKSSRTVRAMRPVPAIPQPMVAVVSMTQL